MTSSCVCELCDETDTIMKLKLKRNYHLCVRAFVCMFVDRTAVKIVRALYDFEPLQKDDLAFRKGDKMKIIFSDNTSV